MVDDGAKHINHLVGGRLADNLMGPRREHGYHIAFVVLDTRHIQRFGTDSFVGECGVGIHHLFHAHFARTQTQGHYRVQFALDTERLHDFDQLFRGEQGHQIGGHPVRRLFQTPCQRHGVALVLGVCVTGGPAVSVGQNKCHGVIHPFLARPHAFIHRKGI